MRIIVAEQKTSSGRIMISELLLRTMRSSPGCERSIWEMCNCKWYRIRLNRNWATRKTQLYSLETALSIGIVSTTTGSLVHPQLQFYWDGYSCEQTYNCSIKYIYWRIENTYAPLKKRSRPNESAIGDPPHYSPIWVSRPFQYVFVKRDSWLWGPERT